MTLFKVDQPGDLLDGITGFFKIPSNHEPEIIVGNKESGAEHQSHETMIDFNPEKKDPWTMLTKTILSSNNPRHKILEAEI